MITLITILYCINYKSSYFLTKDDGGKIMITLPK